MRVPRSVPALVAGVALVVLAGCSPDAPTAPAPPLGEAVGTYSAVRDDALAALQGAQDLAWAESGTTTYPSITEQDDGTCVLFVTDATGTGTVGDARAVLTSLASALGPVVEDHGFEPLSGVQSSDVNGDLWVESGDPAGWSVELRGGGQSSPDQPHAVVELSVNGPVTASACDDAALEEALAADG